MIEMRNEGEISSSRLLFIRIPVVVYFYKRKLGAARNCFPVISISWKIILTVGQVQEQFLWRADVLFKQNNSVLEFRNFSSSQEKRHTVVAHKSTLPSPVRGSFLYPPKLIIVPAKSVQLKYIAACSISVFTRTVAYTNMMSRYNSFHGALGGENKKL